MVYSCCAIRQEGKLECPTLCSLWWQFSRGKPTKIKWLLPKKMFTTFFPTLWTFLGVACKNYNHIGIYVQLQIPHPFLIRKALNRFFIHNSQQPAFLYIPRPFDFSIYGEAYFSRGLRFHKWVDTCGVVRRLWCHIRREANAWYYPTFVCYCRRYVTWI